MSRNSTSSLGALHPILFFLMVYGISLFLAIFVCRTVYLSLNGDETGNITEKLEQTSTAATALR